MEGFKYTTVGHRGQKFCNPVTEAKYERILSLLPLSEKDRVIDIGAGKCETLIRLVERHGVEAIGIDLNPSFTAEAAKQAEGRADQSRLHIVLGAAAETLNGLAPGFALAICVGSTHVLGGLEPTLAALKRLLRPGGYILVGDCYWKKRPSPEYLAGLGDDESVYLDLAGNVNLLVRSGYTPLWTAVASEDEWDQYESLHTMSIEQFCTEHPDDPDCDALLDRARSWRDLYYQWGRDTLGFSLHLARLA